jgi:hypothetical protein
VSLLDDLISVLVAANVGQSGVNIFASSAAVIPVGMGPYLTLNETGGVAPTRVQNSRPPNTVRPTVQVLVRAGRIAGTQEAWPAAYAMAQAAYTALDGIFNTIINGTFYLKIAARQEVTDMGLDATGNRVQAVFNLDIERVF